MCRYYSFKHGNNKYRTHWVCAPCRRSVKHHNQPRECEWCGKDMVNMGHDFRPPKRGNMVQWRKVALMIDLGLFFHSCGCQGPGYSKSVQTLSQVKNYGN